MPELIITANQSYKLSELAEAASNADSDLIYIVKEVAGEKVAYAVTRSAFLSGVGGNLAIEDGGSAVGDAQTLNFIEGANVTITAVDAGGGQIDVTIAASGGSGTVAWGAITGTLADQTDLQLALDGKLDSVVSSTDNAIARWDGSSGDTLQDSGITIDNSDNLSGVNNRTGNDTDFVSGTAGSSGNLSEWNADGDLVDSSFASSDLIDESDVSGTTRVYTKGQWSTQNVITPSSGDLDFDLADGNTFRATIGAATELQFPTYDSGALPSNLAGSFVIKITFSADVDFSFASGYNTGDSAASTISGLNTEVYALYCYVDENQSLIDVNPIQLV